MKVETRVRRFRVLRAFLLAGAYEAAGREFGVTGQRARQLCWSAIRMLDPDIPRWRLGMKQDPAYDVLQAAKRDPGPWLARVDAALMEGA